MAFSKNVSLKPYNTFGIDVKAKYFTFFSSEHELQQILQTLPAEENILILGGGSNILFTKDFDGVILLNAIKGIEIISEDKDCVYIRAGGGVNWHDFVMYCVEHNYGGVENLSLIPGNVGASPMQNIGAYGVEIKDVFDQLDAVCIATKEVKTFNKKDCRFGYRESVFKKELKGKYIITSVTYRLTKNPVFNISYGALQAELTKRNIHEISLKKISDAVIDIRRSKLPDPAVTGNAGSFFKNPVVDADVVNKLRHHYPGMPVFSADHNFKIPAAWLIEQCGWKGFRKGDAGCYDKQPLVLVNYGKASGSELFELSGQIKQSVFKKFQVELEREVNII
ncbi:UDP-N-acetylmuramate dehydrogenase [soil metagenome]